MSASSILRIALNAADDATGALARFATEPAAVDGLMTALRAGGDDMAAHLDTLDPAVARALDSSGLLSRITANIGDVDRLGRGLADAAISADDAIVEFGRIFGDDVLTEGAEATLRASIDGAASVADDFVEGGADAAARVDDFAARIAARGADEVVTSADDVIETARRAYTGGDQFTVRAARAGQVLAVGAIGTMAVEYTTGGAVSNMTINALISAAEFAQENNLPFADELTSAALSGLEFTLGVANAGRTALHNGAVRAAMESGETPEDSIRLGQQAAMSWQLTDPAGLAVDYFVISQQVKLNNPDMPAAERNALIANGMIDRLVENASVAALGDNAVTREDAEAFLIENAHLINDPRSPVPGTIRLAMAEAIPGFPTADVEPTLVADATTVPRRGWAALTEDTPALEISTLFQSAVDNKSNLGLMSQITLFIADWLVENLGGYFNGAVGREVQRMAVASVQEEMSNLTRDIADGVVERQGPGVEIADGSDGVALTVDRTAG